MADPYVYPGTNTLVNKFGLIDPEILDTIETALVSIRTQDLSNSKLSGDYDTNHLYNMHGFLFGDIYDWAGEPRTIDIVKPEKVLGGLSLDYCGHQNINHALLTVLQNMKEINWQGLSQEEKVKQLADYYARLWQIHPFREGNTRTVTNFWSQYADSRGLPIDKEFLGQHGKYLRNSLVAANARFDDIGDFSAPEYLYKIVGHSLRRGQEKVNNRVFSIEPEETRDIKQGLKRYESRNEDINDRSRLIKDYGDKIDSLKRQKTRGGLEQGEQKGIDYKIKSIGNSRERAVQNLNNNYGIKPEKAERRARALEKQSKQTKENPQPEKKQHPQKIWPKEVGQKKPETKNSKKNKLIDKGREFSR